MNAFWSPQAVQDRVDIWDYIAFDNPRAAVAMDELFGLAVARLCEHPKLGRLGQTQGTRELIVHESYRLVYEIHIDTIWILALVHTAKQWPSMRH